MTKAVDHSRHATPLELEYLRLPVVYNDIITSSLHPRLIRRALVRSGHLRRRCEGYRALYRARVSGRMEERQKRRRRKRPFRLS